MRKLRYILAVLAVCACAQMKPPPSQAHWAIYYDKKLPASTFEDYGLVVFDRFRHPDLDDLKGRTTLLAYVSVGEVNEDVPEKQILIDGKALLGEKTVWNSHHIDISQPAWVDFVMAEVADAQKQGFDGVMLDTMDSPLARSAPKDEAWVQNREVMLVHAIRQHYPDMKIMINRGFAILPKVAPFINYALAESTLAQTDVSTGQSRLFPPNSYQFAVSKLQAARQVAPQLKIYTLDYWNQDDVVGLEKIYAIHRAQGFTPYVSTPDLRRYTPEPDELHTANVPLPVREMHNA